MRTCRSDPGGADVARVSPVLMQMSRRYATLKKARGFRSASQSFRNLEAPIRRLDGLGLKAPRRADVPVVVARSSEYVSSPPLASDSDFDDNIREDRNQGKRE